MPSRSNSHAISSSISRETRKKHLLDTQIIVDAPFFPAQNFFDTMGLLGGHSGGHLHFPCNGQPTP